jgi:hypothetical protein
MREKFHAAEIGKNTMVVYQKSDRKDIGNTIQLPEVVGGFKIKQWGSKNDLPQYRDQLLMDNNIVGELLDTKRNIMLGKGLAAYKEEYGPKGKKVFQVEIPPEIKKWMNESQVMDLAIDPAAINLVKHANYFAESVTDAKGRITSVKVHDSRYIRAAEKKNGVIPFYVYSTRWKNMRELDHEEITEAILAWHIGKKLPRGKFVLHVADNVFHDGYYGHPAYWGGHEWIRVSNAIPEYHEANLANGYSIRFVISYPEGYFLDKYDLEAALAANDSGAQEAVYDKEAQAKQAFINKMNALLSGNENAGRALYVEEVFNQITKDYKGIKVEPVTFDMKDEALLELFDKTNQANISSQGIHPTLANIETAGRLSSGSEMRNAFNFYVNTKTPRPRRLILKIWAMVMMSHGWDHKYADLKFGFEDFQLAKLDENKTGVENKVNGEKQEDE